MRTASPVASLLALAAVAVGVAASDPVVKSTWKTNDPQASQDSRLRPIESRPVEPRPIEIDGQNDDWASLTAVETGLGVAASNDAEFLYLVVSTSEPRMRRALARGLVLWFDPANKKKFEFGVQWPGTVTPGSDPAAAAPLSPAALEDLDFLGVARVRHLVTLTPALGVAAASGTTAGALTFEVKLPLVSSAARTYAVGAPAGRSVQVGLFTPDAPRDAARDQREMPRANPSTFGLGPIVGGPSSGVPDPDGSRAPKVERPVSLKNWIVLQLASPR